MENSEIQLQPEAQVMTGAAPSIDTTSVAYANINVQLTDLPEEVRIRAEKPDAWIRVRSEGRDVVLRREDNGEEFARFSKEEIEVILNLCGALMSHLWKHQISKRPDLQQAILDAQRPAVNAEISHEQ